MSVLRLSGNALPARPTAARVGHLFFFDLLVRGIIEANSDDPVRSFTIHPSGILSGDDCEQFNPDEDNILPGPDLDLMNHPDSPSDF